MRYAGKQAFTYCLKIPSVSFEQYLASFIIDQKLSQGPHVHACSFLLIIVVFKHGSDLSMRQCAVAHLPLMNATCTATNEHAVVGLMYCISVRYLQSFGNQSFQLAISVMLWQMFTNRIFKYYISSCWKEDTDLQLYVKIGFTFVLVLSASSTRCCSNYQY